jgi:hypothetical protein
MNETNRNKQINLRISEKDKDRLQAEAEALNCYYPLT